MIYPKPIPEEIRRSMAISEKKEKELAFHQRIVERVLPTIVTDGLAQSKDYVLNVDKFGLKIPDQIAKMSVNIADAVLKIYKERENHRDKLRDKPNV